MEDLQRTQIELLEMKATVWEMKNNGRLDIEEERINEVEDIAIDTIQNETEMQKSSKN